MNEWTNEQIKWIRKEIFFTLESQLKNHSKNDGIKASLIGNHSNNNGFRQKSSMDAKANMWKFKE